MKQQGEKKWLKQKKLVETDHLNYKAVAMEEIHKNRDKIIEGGDLDGETSYLR